MNLCADLRCRHAETSHVAAGLQALPTGDRSRRPSQGPRLCVIPGCPCVELRLDDLPAPAFEVTGSHLDQEAPYDDALPPSVLPPDEASVTSPEAFTRWVEHAAAQQIEVARRARRSASPWPTLWALARQALRGGALVLLGGVILLPLDPPTVWVAPIPQDLRGGGFSPGPLQQIHREPDPPEPQYYQQGCISYQVENMTVTECQSERR